MKKSVKTKKRGGEVVDKCKTSLSILKKINKQNN